MSNLYRNWIYLKGGYEHMEKKHSGRPNVLYIAAKDVVDLGI
jgi:hypothetical protein